MAKRQKVEESQKVDASGVDFLLLCEDIVLKMEGAVKGGKLMNARICESLTTKLSDFVACTRKAVESCHPRYRVAFAPFLLALYRIYEKAEVAVRQCGEENWCAAAVFQHCNRYQFDYILDRINDWRVIFNECVMELTVTSTLMPYLKQYEAELTKGLQDEAELTKGLQDEAELRKRLEDLASEQSNSSFRIFGFFLPDQGALKQQHLARFLLKKETYWRIGSTSIELKTFLWEKENEPAWTWGDVKFLGSGSGASGVLKTSWLGVPCAKKEFHGEVSEAMFMKEVGIMARLYHPCIVDFICYGNGEGKGDRFIAMELMEKSLFDLIKEQKGVHFSLEVALDIISQIATGVEYLHGMGVAHRDLKPHNVVVNTLRSPYHEDYYCVKLVDFGTCKSEVEASKSNTMSYRGIGTTRYRAPEVHPSAHPKGLGKVNWFDVDAYSFAMTCAHILTLKEPYEELESVSSLYTEISKGRRPILPRECPKELVDLLEQCWSTMVTTRPNFKVIGDKLKNVMISNMQQRMNEVMFLMDDSTNCHASPYDVKEEEYEIKEEGHTSFFTAQDVSLCGEVVSQVRDSKHDVMSPLEEAKVNMENLETVKMEYPETV